MNRIIAAAVPAALAVAAAAAVAAAGPVKSGRASVELLAARDGYQPGRALTVAVRMRLDDGWHGYWQNPGEGGMPTSVEWELPPGWRAGPLQYPVPVRFENAGLVGFGYAGEVVLPVVLDVPPDARGRVELRTRLRWLTCDASACVPGNAELALALGPGDAPSAAAPAIEAALAQVPRPLAGATLAVEPLDGALRLRLALPAGLALDPAALRAFPVTDNVVDAAATITFAKAAAGWEATVANSEYAAGPPAGLALVLAGGGLPHPVALHWVAGGRPGRPAPAAGGAG